MFDWEKETRQASESHIRGTGKLNVEYYLKTVKHSTNDKLQIVMAVGNRRLGLNQIELFDIGFEV